MGFLRTSLLGRISACAGEKQCTQKSGPPGSQRRARRQRAAAPAERATAPPPATRVLHERALPQHIQLGPGACARARSTLATHAMPSLALVGARGRLTFFPWPFAFPAAFPPFRSSRSPFSNSSAEVGGARARALGGGRGGGAGRRRRARAGCVARVARSPLLPRDWLAARHALLAPLCGEARGSLAGDPRCDG